MVTWKWRSATKENFAPEMMVIDDPELSRHRDKEALMLMRLCSMLLIALTLFCLPVQAAPRTDSSQKDRAKKCEDTAKNRGLKGDEKATFMSSCMAAKDTASSAENNMSPQEQQKADKAKSCEQQADQQSLKGKDRRSFLKTCSSK